MNESRVKGYRDTKSGRREKGKPTNGFVTTTCWITICTGWHFRGRDQRDLHRVHTGWPLMLHSSCQQLCLGELVLGFYGFHSQLLLDFLIFCRNSNLVEITVSYRLRIRLSERKKCYKAKGKSSGQIEPTSTLGRTSGLSCFGFPSGWDMGLNHQILCVCAHTFLSAGMIRVIVCTCGDQDNLRICFQDLFH